MKLWFIVYWLYIDMYLSYVVSHEPISLEFCTSIKFLFYIQEMDHLKMAVAKVEAHHPNILLVEKSVSRYAQEYLLAKNITLVLNIKKPLLERIARCTGSQIVPSIDHLSSPKLGHCDKFHVEKFVEEHGSSSQGGKKLVKTLMYFEGCPKPLGCTVSLSLPIRWIALLLRLVIHG